MATIKKYFYPPRPGNGAGTFSDNIVGLQIVDGGGLTQSNFEFRTGIVEKVNRKFNVGAFAEPVNLEDLNIDNLVQSSVLSEQFSVYPQYDISQPLNFSMYGSFAKRLSVSVTKIINYFPASIDVLFTMTDFTTGDTAVNISYDQVENETYFEVNVNRINNPFGIDYSLSATTNQNVSDNEVSKYRNLFNTYSDYAIVIGENEYKVLSFKPSDTLTSGYISFYVSGTPFGTTATTSNVDFNIRPNDYVVDKVFTENFDEIEQFLLNRLIQPIYTAVFQVPQQNEYGQFYTQYLPVTWQKDGVWNLDIRSQQFDDYLQSLQDIAENLDSFKTNLISRFLTSDSLKDFDTLGRKVEKVLQLYGRSFDEIKKYIDGLAYINSVNYNPENDIPNELLVNLAQTLGWNSNFSPIVNEDYLSTIFGNGAKNVYPGYAKALTPTELNYAFYRNLILNSAYIFKSKGTRRSVEFVLNLIGIPESILEYNEHIYIADNKIDIEKFYNSFSKISGGTYVDEVPQYDPGNIFRLKGKTYTGITNQSIYEDVSVSLSNYPIDLEGYPKSPIETNSMFFQKGAGWYESTPSHRSPEQVQITGNVYVNQNYSIQTQLKPFTYGQDYLDIYTKFPYMDHGFNIEKIIDNNKSWLSTDNKLRVSTQGNYNAYYFVEDEKLTINVKNVDLFINPGQGLVYDVWDESVKYNYPIPNSGLTINYPQPGGVDSTFINPEPNKKTFFEFSQTFWQNMINVRNRLYITDGKTGGYPTLQSLWWKYILSEVEEGLPNNKYTYQKLIDYSLGINPSWMKLVDQMIPATTIWQGGIKYENSVLHKQKFPYRRQRGCKVLSNVIPGTPCSITSTIFINSQNVRRVTLNVFPWNNNNVGVSSFSGILNNRLNVLATNNNVLNNTLNYNSLESKWYVELRLGSQILIQTLFYTGHGPNDVPTNNDWKVALNNALPSIVQYNLNYFLNGNNLTITTLTSSGQVLNQNITLNVGIQLNINSI
jgi:hypothetical protein